MLRRIIDLLILPIIVGVPAFFTVTYTGPFQWLAEIQLATLGRYDEAVTFIATFVLWLFFCLVMAAISRRMLVKWIKPRPATDNKLGLGPEIFVSFIGGLLAITVALVALGIYFEYLHDVTVLQHVQYADLAQGSALPSRYVAIEGAVADSRLDHAVTETKNGSSDTTHYLPILPPNYKVGDPVYAFVEILERSHTTTVPSPPTGLALYGRLPGMVRVSFKRADLTPATHYILLRFGSTPADYRSDALFLIIIGIAGFLFVIFVLMRIPRRNRQSPPPSKPNQWQSPTGIPPV